MTDFHGYRYIRNVRVASKVEYTGTTLWFLEITPLPYVNTLFLPSTPNRNDKWYLLLINNIESEKG